VNGARGARGRVAVISQLSVVCVRVTQGVNLIKHIRRRKSNLMRNYCDPCIEDEKREREREKERVIQDADRLPCPITSACLALMEI
jgi:hypothetical protein